jgi:CubicO group peptidase (beta-lactamase class C family)
MHPLVESVGQIAASTGFSGVIRVDRPDDASFARAYGLAHRGHGIANAVDTRFGIASGTKGLTAVTVLTLIESEQLELATTARSVLGDDLPLIDGGVTVEHLLTHRSGIDDYLDEEAVESPSDYVMPVPVHLLAGTEEYVRVLAGHRQVSAPGQRFSYNNGGFVVLALIAERASGVSFERLVQERVCEPAGMSDTAFLRSDEPTGRTALGYLDVGGLRTNVLHLPVLGSGDGGIYSTAADVHAFWMALLSGRLVSAELVAEMMRPRAPVASESMRYGLGMWIYRTGDAMVLEGSDAGVSFRTLCDPVTRFTYTVLSNTTAGAWPIVRHIEAHLAP